MFIMHISPVYGSSTHVYFEPQIQTVTIDSTAIFIIKVDSVYDLKGYEVVLIFDGEAIEVVEVIFGDYFESFTLRFLTVDSLGWRVTVTEVLAGGGGISRKGDLFRIRMKGKFPSFSEITLSEVDLRNSLNEDIPTRRGSAYLTIGDPSVVEDGIGIDKGFAVYQNYPNPFNARTIIPVELAVPGNVTISIYTLTGQELPEYRRTVFSQAGTYTYEFNADILPSGIYYYRVEIVALLHKTRYEYTRPMVLTR
jgi:hypothetical protein